MFTGVFCLCALEQMPVGIAPGFPPKLEHNLSRFPIPQECGSTMLGGMFITETFLSSPLNPAQICSLQGSVKDSHAHGCVVALLCLAGLATPNTTSVGMEPAVIPTTLPALRICGFCLNQRMSLRAVLGKEYFSKMIIFITVGIQFSKHSVLFGFMLQTTTVVSQMLCSSI